ncbi:zinc finger protein 831 [Channa argus]|uniref:zinc finger protein 831 n=1 Tax=Channa argus TaxID=215402 RepID=UPI002944DC61|nr:hypothetical protein Q8A73_005140 [Channa argus]
METGKPGLASAPVHISSSAAQTEKRMDIQAPLAAVYIHTVPALPAQPYPQPTAAVREPATLHLAMPPLYSKETLPFLTLHIAGGLQSQAGLSLAAAAPAARPKSAGKHVCGHCGRDCMKPSVLEKHLRCHTGERPYPCTTCGVSFKTQSNLYKHKRTQAHARHSSESEQSSLGSLDGMSSSRDTHTSSMSMDEHTDESGSMEKDATLPATTCPAHTTQVYAAKIQESVSEQSGLTPAGHNTEPKAMTEEEKQRGGNEKSPLTISRHLPLQRQEATLFSKQWESSVSGGKSQSHESTDSGFSESSDHYPSPASVLPDHSMDSVAESTKEHLEEVSSTQTTSEPGHSGLEPKDAAREQEQKKLEERISKLISDNTAVVEDKQLDNVRPRKTVLSKQGSIDLPMPYTYKDSFHFDMKMSNVGSQRNRKPGLYSSVPTQHSTTIEHAPLTRSNSLPFSVTLLQPERSSPTASYQRDYETLFRRGSSGHIHPTNFTIKPVNQQSSTHRPLVRQTAVDCNHATDGLFVNSSVEEAFTGSLSCDGDGGDISAEPSNRKFRRKKTQKFAYNKWYMYGGGTFKKLYNADNGGDNTVIKGRKCINPEHEVVQGPQKRLSAVHKETATITSSTSSSATVCHPGCPPAKPSLISAVDFELKTSHLHSSSSALKTPLHRNLSLSVLPLPSVGSLVGLRTSSMSSTEAGRFIHEDKHTDATSQLCGAHVPSDRKKQRTDDKMVFSLSMETDPKTVTHPPPSVSGSVPQQDTNLSYTNYQRNQHTQLKGACFAPCIINANASSVSTSLATSISSAAKTSFLPKYQLKLPNAAVPNANSSPPAVYKPTGTDGCTFTSAVSSAHTEQSSRLISNSEKTCGDPLTSPKTCDNKKTISLDSAQTQLILPCTATTRCQAKLSRFSENVTFSLPVIHRQVAATTITTTCLKNYQAGLCSTLIEPSKSASGSVPMQLARPVAPVVASVPTTPTTSANTQTSAAASPPFSPGQPNANPPLPHSHLSPASDQLNPVNRAFAGPNTPVVPCQIVPFDKTQPVGQNVFHVHTADLQICLQIISDEQLALIEPQIEQQAGCCISQRREEGVLAPESLPNKGQSSVTMEISSEARDHQQAGHQKQLDPSEGLPKLNTESIKPPLSLQFGKVQPNIHMTEHSNCSQSTVSAESKPLETLGLKLRPHKYSNVSTATQTLSSVGDVMSTAASLIGVKSEKHQTSEEEHALCVNCSTENQIVLDSQHSLSVASLSPTTEDQICTKSELLGKESQETSSLSINKCKGPRHSNPQAITCCINPPEPTETVKPANHANTGCDRVELQDSSAPLQAMTHSESKDVISSAHSEEQLIQFTSVSPNIQVQRPKDVPAVPTTSQSPAAGLMEGAPLLGQKELQSSGHEGTPGQPDSTACRQNSQEAEETTHNCVEGHGDGGVTGENKTDQGEDRKVKTDAFKNSWLSEQHLKHLSQTHSGMSENPPQSLQQAPSTSKNLVLPSSSSHTNLFNSPLPPLEINNFYVSQYQWENSITHSHGGSNVSEPFKAPAQLTEAENAFSRTDSSHQQTHTSSHVDGKRTLSIQQENPTKRDNSSAGRCCTKVHLGRPESPNLSPEAKTPFSTHHCHISHSLQVGQSRAEWTGNTNTGPTTKSFTYPGPEQDPKDWKPNDYTTQGSNSERPDITHKYQSFFLAGQFHGFQPGECLTSGVRPVQSCQDYSEDTSSSDDEGKLIIEL